MTRHHASSAPRAAARRGKTPPSCTRPRACAQARTANLIGSPPVVGDAHDVWRPAPAAWSCAVLRPWSSLWCAGAGDSIRVALAGVLSDRLLIDSGDARGDRLPAEAFLRVGCGSLPAAAPIFAVRDGPTERFGERQLVVGGNEPTGLAVADDFSRAVRVTGDHGKAAGHGLDQRETECLCNRRKHEQVGSVERRWKLVVWPPAGEEDVASALSVDRRQGMLAFPLTRVAADQDERELSPEPGLDELMRSDEQGQPPDGGETSEVEENRLRAERGKVVLPIGDGAGHPLLVPALRVMDEPAPPERLPRPAGKGSRPEALELETAWKPVQARALESEYGGHLGLGTGGHDQSPTTLRPETQALLPGPRVLPISRRTYLQATQERELSAVQLADDRHPRKGAQRRLVDRRQMVQVEKIGLRGAGAGQRVRPGGDQPLVGRTVDLREDAVGARRSVLIRGLKGDAGGKRIRKLEGGRVVDRRDVYPGVEAGGVRLLAPPAKRAARERDLPPARGEGTGQSAHDLRGASARKEEKTRADAAATGRDRRSRASIRSQSA